MSKSDPNTRTTLFEAFAICMIFVGVAVVIYAIGRAAGVDIGRNEVTARQHYDAVKNSALAACVDTEPAALRECVLEAVEAAQIQSESRQNLYAQQDMSRWAFAMVVISGLTLFITGLGIVWIRDTLLETRKAVKAADDAVTVTREVGHAQIRPWVNISDVEVVDGPFAYDSTSPHLSKAFVVNFVFKIKNHGASPANKLKVFAIGAKRIRAAADILPEDRKYTVGATIESLKKGEFVGSNPPLSLAPGESLTIDSPLNSIRVEVASDENTRARDILPALVIFASYIERIGGQDVTRRTWAVYKVGTFPGRGSEWTITAETLEECGGIGIERLDGDIE